MGVQAYRMEDFETAKSLYYILSREDSSPAPGGERQDFSINMKAVDVQVDWTSDRMSVPAAVLAGNKIDGFEDAFNLGCRFMAIGDLTKAELLLQKAARKSSYKYSALWMCKVTKRDRAM